MPRLSVRLLALCCVAFHPDAALAQEVPLSPESAALDTQQLAQSARGPVLIMTNRSMGGPIMMSVLDLSTLLDDGERFQKMRVIPLIARGKMQNLWDILYLRYVDMGFLQSGTLEYLKDEPQIKSIRDRIPLR